MLKFFKYANLLPTHYESDKYIEVYRKVFEEVYEVDPDSYDGMEESWYKKYDDFYGITLPKHFDDRTSMEPLTVEKLIFLHSLTMKGTENDYIIGKIRNDTTWAYNPTFPLLHAPPEHVQPLLEVLCEWFNSWWKVTPTMSTSEVTEFALSMIPRIVLIHPYMDGNKRTSRFLANIILHHRNLSIFKWDFNDMQLRTEYQHSFGRALMRGDLASCVDLHMRKPGFVDFKREDGTEDKFYEMVGGVLFGEEE